MAVVLLLLVVLPVILLPLAGWLPEVLASLDAPETERAVTLRDETERAVTAEVLRLRHVAISRAFLAELRDAPRDTAPPRTVAPVLRARPAPRCPRFTRDPGLRQRLGCPLRAYTPPVPATVAVQRLILRDSRGRCFNVHKS